ncbi:MAG: calcium-transporting P-type ATPase, PMR1-type [Bacillaceae bacterium]|nr:calcium-transporting P-type ATPase, PMR1-type [Bacillaceae bacterium]
MRKQREWYSLDKTEVLAILKSDAGKGLTSKEAQKRLDKTGENEIKEKDRISPFTLLLNQFKDFMVLVLLAATLISGLLGEYTDAITIIAIVVINGILGFVQEFRAEKSLKALKELTAPMARVIRDGNMQEIAAKELVPGDIVVFEGGDRVPADIRILSAKGLQIEESALTGESLSVQKHDQPIDKPNIPLGDQENMAFMGTMVTQGSGRGVVVATGMSTEMGKIADLLQSTDSLQTPLQKRLEQLGKVLVGVAIALTVLVVVAGIWHGHSPYQMFLAGVSLAVAAIPEGLPAIVTIALALGVQRMIKRRAIVRKLPSVETLGCATVICSDKTGTLTQNKMTVTHLWTDRGNPVEVTGSGYHPAGNFFQDGKEISIRKNSPLYQLLLYGVLCNNSELIHEQKRSVFRKKQGNGWDIKGDPTEGALLVAARKAGIRKEDVLREWRRVEEFPFDSTRKMMSVIAERQKGQRRVVAKGAPDVLLQKCTYLLYQGRIQRMTPSLRQKILHMNDQLAGKALRNLAVAYRDLAAGEQVKSERDAERNLVFVGLMGMIDPPRREVREAIAHCRQAGIRTVMITGDHQATAEAIAAQLGILDSGGLTVNGQDLYNMSDTELKEKVNDIRVYARVSPEHKLRIVKALQSRGHVVAMTGDGVNDAPAIKAADIGVAMGITGTDVTREASSLILADDNFATIKAAIEEGRNIYDNIRKFIRYLLASNVGEILVMFMAMMAGMPLPLVPIQILWVNLVTDGLPAMALGVDSAEEDVMNRPPRPKNESVFSRGLGWKIVSRGFLIGISTLAVFWLSLQQEPDQLVKAQTMAFTTLVMAQLIHVFDCRSEKSVFHRNLLENKWLVLSVIVSVILMLGVIYIDQLQPVFKTVSLGIEEWIIILIFSAIPTFLAGILNLILFKMFRKTPARWANNFYSFLVK